MKQTLAVTLVFWVGCTSSQGPLEPLESKALPNMNYQGWWQSTDIAPDGTEKKGKRWRVVVSDKRFRLEEHNPNGFQYNKIHDGEQILHFSVAPPDFTGETSDGVRNFPGLEKDLQDLRFWTKKPSSKPRPGESICGQSTRSYDTGSGTALVHADHIVMRQESWRIPVRNKKALAKALAEVRTGDFSNVHRSIIECESFEQGTPDESEFTP